MRYLVASVWLLASICCTSRSLADDTANGLPLVFKDDFENGREHWETTDDKSWELHADVGNQVLGLNKRISDFQPKVRSPHNIALIKDIQVADFVLTFKVRSTKDTGNHRDCCIFFGYQDAENFYYAHLGAKPDPASGQIMIVKAEPRRPLTDNKKTVPWNDQWHAIKVVRDSSTGAIDVYFDDLQTPQLSVRDKTFAKGRIGIGSFDDMNDFDDVRLYGQ